MTKADQKLLFILLLIGLLTFAVGKFFYYAHEPEPQSRAVIKVSGKVVKTINLQEQAPLERHIITGKKGKAILETKGLKVRMLEAPCPDQICVNQGWIDNPLQAIVCVPNEVVVHFEEKAAVDDITG